MSNRAIDPVYLRYQYGDAEKLRIRQETHARFSEATGSFIEWVVTLLNPQPGQVVVDVGCGPGTFHPSLAWPGTKIIGIDTSWGMIGEVAAQAQDRRLPVHGVQANAEMLPLDNACCDCVLASHMLYHVPDQMTALREMRRILRPGGRVLLSNNASEYLAELYDIHRKAAQQCGYTFAGWDDRFSVEGLDFVRTAFPSAVAHTWEDAFVFSTAEPLLRYYATSLIDRVAERPVGDCHRAELLPVVEAHVQAALQAEGVLRIPKRVVCFVAEV